MPGRLQRSLGHAVAGAAAGLVVAYSPWLAHLTVTTALSPDPAGVVMAILPWLFEAPADQAALALPAMLLGAAIALAASLVGAAGPNRRAGYGRGRLVAGSLLFLLLISLWYRIDDRLVDHLPSADRHAVNAWAIVGLGRRAGSRGDGMSLALSRLAVTREPLIGQDLSCASRQDAPMLTGGNPFHDAVMIGADLSGCTYHNPHQPLDLRRADLRGADLSRASLVFAVLVDARLDGADLTGADLEQANLAGASGVTQAQIDAAGFLCQTILPDGRLSERDCPGLSPMGNFRQSPGSNIRW